MISENLPDMSANSYLLHYGYEVATVKGSPFDLKIIQQRIWYYSKGFVVKNINLLKIHVIKDVRQLNRSDS